jgi:ABC-2 type transport system permease protein
MWFTSIYRKTLRDCRWALLGWGLGLGILAYVEAAEYAVTATPQARASLASLGPTFAWYSAPIAMTTPGGMTSWRMGPILVLLSVWALLASSRVLRGEEEEGSLDVLLTRPRRRLRVALEKLGALLTALLVMGLLVGLLTYAGGRQINVDLGLGPSLLLGLDAALLAAVVGALALLVSQFTEQRSTAAGVTGGLLFVFLVMDMAHRVFPHTEWISRLSPVYYYNLSKPLIPGYGTNPGAMLFLGLLAVVLTGLALALSYQRDIGRRVALPRWVHGPEWARRAGRRQSLPEAEWSLRTSYLRSLREVAAPTGWWTLGVAGFAGFMALEVKQTESHLTSILTGSPFWTELMSRVGGGEASAASTLLSFFYLLLPLLVMAFAITQVNRWAADVGQGRMELVLARPQPRSRLLLARFAALTTATIVMAALTLAATVLASAGAGLGLDPGHVAAAAISMVPLGLLIAALGYLLSGWLGAAPVTSILSALLVFSCVISLLGPTLNWSGAILRLSLLWYYGKPLVDGIAVGEVLGVLAVALVGLGLAATRFARRDLAY